MKVEQFIVDIHQEHAALISMLPSSFVLQEDMLRIRFEIRSDFDGMTLALAHLLPVSAFDKNGWLCVSEEIFPIEAVRIDFTEVDGKATISFQTDTLYAAFTELGIEAPADPPQTNQGEFTLQNNTVLFTPSEVILSTPNACKASVQLKDQSTVDIIRSKKNAFDRYPRCGCCGPQEEVFSLPQV